jgi:uncharacterized secreted protein with C-terminal beta-propeller domain
MRVRYGKHIVVVRLLSGALLGLVSGLTMAQGAPAVNSLQGSGSLTNVKQHRYADVLVEGDVVSAQYDFTPAAADVGKSANLYVVARVDDGTSTQWFNLSGGRWLPWNSNVSTLRTFATKTLQAQEQLQLVSAQPLFAGDYQVYAGYQVSGGALTYSSNPLGFSVAAVDSDALQRFMSPEAMEAYLKEGLEKSADDLSYLRTLPFVMTLDSAASTAAGAVESRTSSTNLQESGVDEADTVKVSGNNLFRLTGCDDAPCVAVERLDSAAARALPVSTFKLDTKNVPEGMYRVQDGILGQDMLVTVAGQFGGWGWFNIWGGWQDSKTELNFLNIANPASLSRIEQLTFDGALVSSRVVGGTLYLVTRYTPGLPGYLPYPVDKAEEEKNAAVLARAELPQILPHVRDSRDDVKTLVEAKDCYLPVSAVDGSHNPSIITITAVPLKNPVAHKSTCFLGASETLYMTPDSLYLATTSWDYDVNVLAATSIRYNPEHTTAIHKFALGGGNIVYRGSGTVQGHLGWNEDKKSFRMGENGAYLNVATSVGETWGGTSSTRLTVLKEAGNSRLEPVSVIDGIGKPGEQLYAARFLGNRAYLVTFRITDPLYVVDLSNQEKPRIAGELEIDGYSDYLHPISENLVLGIGKDAIPSTTASDFGGRGAWYQGVKVALFDVANPAQPKEVDSIVLGKRGTESDVLWDHHAFSYLPAVGTTPARFAIPVRLNETKPAWERWDGTEPNAWYDYTHTGLYSFEASAQGLSQAGRIVADLAPPLQAPRGDGGIVASDTARSAASTSSIAPIYFNYGDRSVLKDDAVFYIHDGKVLTSMWGESKSP